MGSNEKKSATLGMPHGTATHRLRKIVLFDVLKRHNEAICFKCGEQIEVVEELSIEHKKPWEGISAELFWDLENITFSHLHCNRPHTNHGGEGKRKQPPPGMAWCAGHNQFLLLERFYSKSTRWNGIQINCKECHDIKRGRKVSVGM